MGELLLRSDKDPKDFLLVYDDLIEYLLDEQHLEIMAEELKSRNVQCMNFYDIMLDYILIDSFEVCFSKNFKKSDLFLSLIYIDLQSKELVIGP